MPGVFKAPRAESIRTHRVVRYLTYAVGEVLLIFIGITLAVAFGNMNEQRRTEDLERQILEAIVRNLEANVVELDRNIDEDEVSAPADGGPGPRPPGTRRRSPRRGPVRSRTTWGQTPTRRMPQR